MPSAMKRVALYLSQRVGSRNNFRVATSPNMALVSRHWLIDENFSCGRLLASLTICRSAKNSGRIYTRKPETCQIEELVQKNPTRTSMSTASYTFQPLKLVIVTSQNHALQTRWFLQRSVESYSIPHVEAAIECE